jgi:hypothetical protein
MTMAIAVAVNFPGHPILVVMLVDVVILLIVLVHSEIMQASQLLGCLGCLRRKYPSPQFNILTVECFQWY